MLPASRVEEEEEEEEGGGEGGEGGGGGEEEEDIEARHNSPEEGHGSRGPRHIITWVVCR